MENGKTSCGKGWEKRKVFHREKQGARFPKSFQRFSEEWMGKFLGLKPHISLEKRDVHSFHSPYYCYYSIKIILFKLLASLICWETDPLRRLRRHLSQRARQERNVVLGTRVASVSPRLDLAAGVG